MAGNRTEFVLSIISKTILDVNEGMSQSCSNIEQALLKRVNDLKSRQKHVAVNDINLDYLREKNTPLLEDLDNEITYKKRYATLVVLNLNAHYKYACVAVQRILNSIRKVLIDDFNTRAHDKGPAVISLRPHTLGAIKPPETSDVISALKKEIMENKIHLDANIVSEELKYLINEVENFKSENSINKAFDGVSMRGDIEKLSRVEEIKDVKKLIEEGNDTINNHLIHQRPVFYGVDWRPSLDDWGYSFENLWGDNTITINTLSAIFIEVVIPNIQLSNFLLYMCNHIRAVIKSVKIILFDGKRNEVFLEEEFSDWDVWMDLRNKLEWFMLVARYVIFLHSKKDIYLREKDDDNTILVEAIESIPPYILVQDWVEKNLFSWPSGKKSETISTELLLSLGLRTSSGAKHLIFEKINKKDYAITNRISIGSATFCTCILLGRALEEELAGTKIMVAPKEENIHEKLSNNTDNHFGIIPSEILCVESCSGVVTTSPFISNPTYYLKKIWNIESPIDVTLNETSRKENDSIVTNVLKNARHLLFDSGSGEWASLKLFSCCQAPTLIHKAWMSALKGRNDPDMDSLQNHFESTGKELCEKIKESHLKKTKAYSEIKKYLSEIIRDIQDSNNNSSLAAENALWATSVWKKAATTIFSSLSLFPN